MNILVLSKSDRLLSTIPTVGHKTARYAFHLLRRNNDDLQNLAKAIAELKNNITVCKNCFAFPKKIRHVRTDKNKNILCKQPTEVS